MEGELKHLISTLLWVVSSLSYCYFISSRIPKGLYRLISILPIFYIFTILPLSHSYVVTSFATTFAISWLANFKLFLFAFNKGPLSTGPQMSLPLFIAIASFPIVIKKNSNPNKLNSLKTLLQKLTIQVLILATFVGLWAEYKELIHPKVMQLLFACPFYLVVDIITSSTHVVVQALTGLELEPPSDEPYLSTSIQNFWGKRWNIAASNIIRVTVFQPTKVASSRFGKNQATYIAYIASFFVSGLMHELVIYNLSKVITWEMTLFFVIHGICIIIELILKRKLNDRFPLPPFVSRILTVAFLFGTGSWLFIPPFARHASDVRFIQEIISVVQFFIEKLHLI